MEDHPEGEARLGEDLSQAVEAPRGVANVITVKATHQLNVDRLPNLANVNAVINALGTTATSEVPGADHRRALPVAPPNGRDLDQGTNLKLKRDLTHLENHVPSSREDRANSEINVTICTILTPQLLPKTKK